VVLITYPGPARSRCVGAPVFEATRLMTLRDSLLTVQSYDRTAEHLIPNAVPRAPLARFWVM
jgi:hypothetical protein